jgi:parallel beta-helix repeat protein
VLAFVTVIAIGGLLLVFHRSGPGAEQTGPAAEPSVASAAPGVEAKAPAGGRAVCDQPILNSPYTYAGAEGSFTAGNVPAGLPTFGAPGTDFPAMTQLVVIPAGDNKSVASDGSFEHANTIYYFAPGVHYIDFMYAGYDSAFIGGYSPTAGRAIIDGVDGGTGGTGVGGSTFAHSQPSAGNVTNNTWQYLTIKNFTSSVNNSVMGNVNGGGSAVGDTYKYNTIGPNQYGWRGDKVPPGKGQSSGGGYGINLSDNTTIQYNCLIENAQGAFNGSGANITISDNEIVANGLGVYPDTGGPGASPYACGCSGGGKLNFSTNATITGNYVHHNYNAGIWIDFNNVGTEISNNYIASNWGQGIFYESSYNANISYNTVIGNGWASDGEWPAGVGGEACFGGVSCTNGLGPVSGAGGENPYSAIYIPNSGGTDSIQGIKDESGADHASRYSGRLVVKGNVLIDNFGGVDVYTDTDRFPSGINNNSACSVPLNGGSATYYRQTKYLRAKGATISGATVTSGSGAQTLCSDYDTGAQDNGYQEQVAKTPAVGMAVYDLDSGAFLGNVAGAADASDFTLDRSPGDARDLDLLISAYGGCGPASYYGGGLGRPSGQPAANYWDNCIWGSRNVTVTENTFIMNSDRVAGCSDAANRCGFMRAAAFNAGVPTLMRYFNTYPSLIAKANGGLGNVWSNNKYTWTGPGQWQFQAGLQGNAVSRSAWQADPYGQDAGSTFE